MNTFKYKYQKYKKKYLLLKNYALQSQKGGGNNDNDDIPQGLYDARDELARYFKGIIMERDLTNGYISFFKNDDVVYLEDFRKDSIEFNEGMWLKYGAGLFDKCCFVYLFNVLYRKKPFNIVFSQEKSDDPEYIVTYFYSANIGHQDLDNYAKNSKPDLNEKAPESGKVEFEIKNSV